MQNVREDQRGSLQINSALLDFLNERVSFDQRGSLFCLYECFSEGKTFSIFFRDFCEEKSFTNCFQKLSFLMFPCRLKAFLSRMAFSSGSLRHCAIEYRNSQQCPFAFLKNFVRFEPWAGHILGPLRVVSFGINSKSDRSVLGVLKHFPFKMLTSYPHVSKNYPKNNHAKLIVTLAEVGADFYKFFKAASNCYHDFSKFSLELYFVYMFLFYSTFIKLPKRCMSLSSLISQSF